MAGLIYFVVVDINDIHALNQRLTVCTLQANDVIVFQRNTGSVCCLENLVPVSGIGRLAIRQNTQNTVAALNSSFLWGSSAAMPNFVTDGKMD